ncbi:NAD(P)H-binding protein [Tahibacter amnicola]|uniref:NAD(P)H-binding protein n=1 Tax=Tahibacter amnicola TaxID=2976241 RepID=A0ABY6B828_9GAMM|nr:NAD(P)H-binding protein [Tahibacter amnicola]UXI65829.1 NAD(P)H-binding protein [Tahibacter amnicola]
MIVVMGATGNTGRRIVRNLLAAGHAVRALGRSAERLAPFATLGADVRAGDSADTGFLADAFRGAIAAYVLLPYEPGVADYHAQQGALGQAVATALRESQVPYVVNLSSLGAELSSGNGPIASLHTQEQRLNALSASNVLHLRPGALFENFASALAVVDHHGINADGFEPDVAFPMVSTHDVAVAATDALVARNWRGTVVRELLGPRDLSYAEATRILGRRMGRPDLGYAQLAAHDVIHGLKNAGFSESIATLYAELAQAINAGRIRSLDGRNAANTTPTPFETYADQLVLASTA